MNKTFVMTALRMLIGWHFLYEGLYKLVQPGGWSAEGYLRTSQWFAAPVFHAMAATPWVLKTVDQMNMWGLTLIGLALLIGVLVRPAAFFGVVLLVFYYVAQPPFLAPSADGHFLWFDRNVVEAAALLAVMLVPSYSLGGYLASFPRRLFKRRMGKGDSGKIISPERRELLMSLSSLPVIGAFGYAFFRKHGPVWEVKNLKDKKADAVTGATVKSFDFADIKDLKKKLDKYGKIGNLKVSRMYLGGNLIGGWAHARDLIYVDKLVKAYHNDWRVFRTFRLAEECGMNTIMCHPSINRVVNDYWKKEGGKIQYIADCASNDLPGIIKRAIDGGAHACYIQGGIMDGLVKDGKFDQIQQGLDLIRRNKLPAGLGGHRLETVKGCVDKGIVPDFWVKTLHRTNYWSARPDVPQRDNIWCTNPDETIAYMEKLEQPWIAFKILAAGALKPQDAFPYSFKSGADFICVGMYDFQLVENVNLVTAVLDKEIERKRPWRA